MKHPIARRLLPLLTAVLLLPGAPDVSEARDHREDRPAQHGGEFREERKRHKKIRRSEARSFDRNGISLDDAVSIIREQVDGRVLSAETIGEGRRSEYRVRVLTDQGRVRRFRVDPETGRLIRHR